MRNNPFGYRVDINDRPTSALFDARLARLYNSADILEIDSMPFLKRARTFYKKDSDRLYAPDVKQGVRV